MPASSANLGPGFDVLAAALGLRMELEVEETGRFEVRTDLSIARDRRNLAVRGFSALRPVDGVRFTIRSDIPLSGGLGTSAAAYVAGLAAADALNGGGADLLAEAARLEGHPDNVAAALLGGFVICAGARAERLEPPAGPVGGARGARRARCGRPRRGRRCPPEVPMADAVFNVSRASLLVLGLARGDLELVARGLEDRLHQPRRASLYPRSMELVERARRRSALWAPRSRARGRPCWCGCGRTTRRRCAERLEREAAGWARVMALPFAAAGGVEVA